MSWSNVARRQPLRKPRVSRATHKSAYLCEGGPFADKLLWLSSHGGIASTLTFAARGMRGRYRSDSSMKQYTPCVVWEPVL